MYVVVKFQNGNINIIPTKFDREAGFKMSVDGVKCEVIRMCYSVEERKEFLMVWNEFVRRENNKIMRERRNLQNAAFAQFWSKLYNSNETIRECINILKSGL